MSLFTNFTHHLALSKIDPLGDGLAEEIAAEEHDPESLEFQADIDAQTLQDKWRQTVDDLHNDPNWIDFSDDTDT